MIGLAVRNMVSSVARVRHARTIDAMNAQMNNAFERLVAAWKRRDDLRRTHADVRDLAAARRQLDLARADMARARGY